MNEGTLLGVFDGHGGDEAAALCEDQLPGIFADEIGEPGADALTAIRKAFAKLADLTKELESGTTASVAYFPWNKSAETWSIDAVWVAVLGDSPVIVKDIAGGINISPEHNVRTNMAEKAAAGTCAAAIFSTPPTATDPGCKWGERSGTSILPGCSAGSRI